ncbi:hypothetical protein [Methanosarcina sp. UBA5]
MGTTTDTVTAMVNVGGESPLGIVVSPDEKGIYG